MNTWWADQKNRIVSIADFRFDYPFGKSHNIDYGNIAARLGTAWPRSFGPAILLHRRPVSVRKGVLAAVMAMCLNMPAAAFATGADYASAPISARDAGEHLQWVSERGSASWYGKSPRYKRTASGARFDQHAMTAAHPWLPFGAQVRVTRRDTGKSIVVTINDRLPSKRHIIDLSVGAAQRLGMLREGTTEVELTPEG